jgi:hypothetical protein
LGGKLLSSKLTNRVQTGYRQHIRSSVVNPTYTREHEEEFDRITYRILWDLASNHPEAGIGKMDCLEYHDLPLQEAGLVREGQTDVWFKDLVHNVTPLCHSLTIVSGIIRK